MLWRSLLAALLFLLGNLADAAQQSVGNASRGELLYSTYCVVCHNTRVHWRDKKLSTDGTSLQAEVNRWQEISGLEWGEDDVVAVARYLNHLYYSYPSLD